MNIQPIVEGHGEVSAVPVLLRRLRDEAQLYTLEINSPIRKKRAELVDEAQLRKAVRLALKQEGCGAILVLLDSDDDCPKELAPQLQAWVQSEAGTTPTAVVLAHREYEAWFLAALESLRGTRGIRADATSHPAPETPRGAKGQLEARLAAGRSYSETADQAALSSVFDMAAAYRSCRSFRRLVHAFEQLASGAGEALAVDWPPPAWT